MQGYNWIKKKDKMTMVKQKPLKLTYEYTFSYLWYKKRNIFGLLSMLGFKDQSVKELREICSIARMLPVFRSSE